MESPKVQYKNLYLIYKKDFPQQISSDILLFAGGVELRREICNQEDKLALQGDLNLLQSLMNNKPIINTKRWLVVHVRHAADYEYKLGNSFLEVSQVERSPKVWYPMIRSFMLTATQNQSPD